MRTQSKTSRPDRGYRPDIDGLRAIAVVLVILFHSNMGFPGGFIGVDVFFVISGFLITSIIERDLDAGKFSFVRFWVRRFRRILPAAAFVVIATLIAGYLILLPHDYRELGQSVVAQAVGLSNFFFWREAGYFAGAAELKPLLHTWSLAVEEQFYLLMPIVLVVGHRWARRRHFWFLALIGIASLVWGIWATPRFPSSSFYLLPARAWELLLGSLLVWVVRSLHIGRTSSELLGYFGLAAILVSAFLYGRNTAFPGFAALLPCLGTAAVILGNTSPTTSSRSLLSIKTLVGVGKTSYSLYLWHWPVLVFARYLLPRPLSWIDAVYLLPLILVASLISYRLVEQPFRYGALWNNSKRVLVAASLSVALLFVAGLTLHYSGGGRFRFSPRVLEIADARFNRSPFSKLHHDLAPTALRRNGLPRLDHLPSRLDPKLAILGDSHGDALVPALVSLVNEYQIPTVCATRSATIPLFPVPGHSSSDGEFYDAIVVELEKMQGIKDVVLVGRWAHYPSSKLSESRLRQTYEFFRKRDCRVWVVREVPEPRADVPRVLALARCWSFSAEPLSRSLEEYKEDSRAADQVFENCDATEIRQVALAPYFFGSSSLARVEVDDSPLFWDDNHLSEFGALQLIEVLRPAFDEIKLNNLETNVTLK